MWIYEIVHLKDPADTWDIVAAPETGATSLGDFAWLTLQAHSILGFALGRAPQLSSGRGLTGSTADSVA